MKHFTHQDAKILKVLILYHRLLMLRKRRSRLTSRRWWVRPSLKMQNILGAYRVLFLYFKKYDHEEFQSLTRMTERQFDLLHNLVKRRMQKHSLRKSISSEIRLASVIVYDSFDKSLM